MLKKESVMVGIIGLLLGFIVGFMFANTANQRGTVTTAQGAPQQMAGLPPNHPPVQGAAAPQVDMAAIQAAEKLAKDQPENFDAQMKAAELNYSAHRHAEAVEYFARANKIQPENADAIIGLGNAPFDAENFVEAERWYTAALKQQPDNVNVRTDLGLTFFFREPRDLDRAIKEYRGSLEREPNHPQTLQNLTVALATKGDAAEARAALARLEAVSPQNPVLPRLRSDIEKLGPASTVKTAADKTDK